MGSNLADLLDLWNLHPEHFGERHGLFVGVPAPVSLGIAFTGVLAVVLLERWPST